MFRKIRIAILLLILLFVGLSTWLERVYTTDWNGALQVALYPVNADDSEAAAQFIANLNASELQRLEDFFDVQAKNYGLNIERPFRFTLAPALPVGPPALPAQPSKPNVVLWSLKMRWFAWRLPKPPGPTPSIRVFLLYHDPEHAAQLPDSLGLQKGLLGIAHLFAARTMASANQVIIAHEMLHTLGATDKYDLNNNQPHYPDGYAEPDQRPLYPQARAELMAGRIPLTATTAEQPDSLRQVMIGSLTAHEIGWLKK